MGAGYWAPNLAMVPFVDLYALPPFTGDESSVAQDWYLDGLSAPAPVEIPWMWVSGRLRFRQDKAITHASVSKAGAGTAVASVVADQQVDFDETLDALNDVDAPNLAHFMVTYYDQPRSRLPQLQIVLNGRTRDEHWTLLGLRIGDRIRITDVPAWWPTGADSLVIEGKHHISDEARVIEFATSPVIGETPGEVGPFFRVGVSPLDGTDLLPW
jgi:hypothetical protein